MSREVKNGEFTLSYAMNGRNHGVALTEDQHESLQVLLAGLGKINVIKQMSYVFGETEKYISVTKYP